MKVSDFDYLLPKTRIALFPPKIRGQSRLLVIDRTTGSISHYQYNELHTFLESGDVFVINDTKVIKARLLVTNAQGKSQELLLLEKHGTHYGEREATVLYFGTLHVGEMVSISEFTLEVTQIVGSGQAQIKANKPLLEIIKSVGIVPLPPYIKRITTPDDEDRYQTVFAKIPGSVAAPTASLNFTDELKSKLIQKGVKIVTITLHVGIGTFLPIRTENVEDHLMHQEYFEIPKATIYAIQKAKAQKKKIVAIGTTVARTLEYAHQEILTIKKSLTGEANIFIYPGYKFKIVDHLVTNFHAPRSTVLMLATAFVGKELLMKAYQEALKLEYKFLSYGDSMLLL